jgi:hypothetical protein
LNGTKEVKETKMKRLKEIIVYYKGTVIDIKKKIDHKII